MSLRVNLSPTRSPPRVDQVVKSGAVSPTLRVGTPYLNTGEPSGLISGLMTDGALPPLAGWPAPDGADAAGWPLAAALGRAEAPAPPAAWPCSTCTAAVSCGSRPAARSST